MAKTKTIKLYMDLFKEVSANKRDPSEQLHFESSSD